MLSRATTARGALTPCWPDPLSGVPAPDDAPAVADAFRAALLQNRDPALDGPPVNLARLVAAARLVVSEDTLSAAAGQQEALLVPLRGDRFGICIDPTPRGGWSKIRPRLRSHVKRHRYRFRLAHELGHTLFYDRSGIKPRRVRAGSTEEETFCDEFARALLLPLDAVSEHPPTADAVVSLHRTYDVSLELAARAMAAAHDRVAVALWYQHPDARWRLQWASVPERQTAGWRCRGRLEHERGQTIAVWRMDTPTGAPVATTGL